MADGGGRGHGRYTSLNVYADDDGDVVAFCFPGKQTAAAKKSSNQKPSVTCKTYQIYIGNHSCFLRSWEIFIGYQTGHKTIYLRQTVILYRTVPQLGPRFSQIGLAVPRMQSLPCLLFLCIVGFGCSGRVKEPLCSPLNLV